MAEVSISLCRADGTTVAVLHGTPGLRCKCSKPMLCDGVYTTSQDARWLFLCPGCGAKITLAMEVAEGHTMATR